MDMILNFSFLNIFKHFSNVFDQQKMWVFINSCVEVFKNTFTLTKEISSLQQASEKEYLGIMIQQICVNYYTWLNLGRYYAENHLDNVRAFCEKFLIDLTEEYKNNNIILTPQELDLIKSEKIPKIVEICKDLYLYVESLRDSIHNLAGSFVSYTNVFKEKAIKELNENSCSKLYSNLTEFVQSATI